MKKEATAMDLQERDFVMVIDKSGSMEEEDCPGGLTRFKSAEETTVAVAKKLQALDPDGITVIPFSSTFKVYENTTPDKVSQIFKENQPMGGTILAPVLSNVFKSYLDRKKAGTTKKNGEILVVVTDGAPADEKEVAKTIVNFTKSLDNGDNEYGVLFLQVGKDGGAAKFLKSLDDDLTKQGASHDIVDTKTMEELENIGLTEALLASLND